MSTPPLRHGQPREPITFYGHEGDCRHCPDGIVKMPRDSRLVLHPDLCYCLQCGQPYAAEIPGGDLAAWEALQWEQRGALTYPLLVLYERPSDYPRHYVTRWQTVRGGGPARTARVACLYDTAPEAVAWVTSHWPDLVWLPRERDDDPVVLGCWV